METLRALWQRWKVWWLSAASGALFGCTFRLAFSNSSNAVAFASVLIMTIGFLVIVPFSMGYLGVHRYLKSTPAESIVWNKWLFLPWASVIISMLFALAVKWEGLVCIIYAAPLMLFFSLIGGLTARAIWAWLKKKSPGIVSAFALPILVLLIEAHVPSPQEIRTVPTAILIHAPASLVWDNIKSVRAIAPAELPSTWVNRIGFPLPIAATLSHPGIGGVRQASFTGGLVFTETVSRWEPEFDLRFTIHANTEAIPPTTLDEHVTIGGAFFDVLDGEYQLEQTPNGILLHLVSHQRLSTHFNPYAAAWTDAVMRSIQRQILAVIKNRCEAPQPQS
jgi:hypothetical protein